MDKQRYERNMLCDGFTAEHQKLLADAKVLVVGAGGLGSYVLMHLTAIGVGTIAIAEFDVVSASNLNRQVLYTTNDIGKLKIERARKRLEDINPSVKIVEYPIKIDAVSVEGVVELYDVVVDCTDNYEVRYVLDYSCKKNRIPFVHGSVAGYEGNVKIFSSKENSVGYRDLFGDKQESRAKIGVLSPIVGVVGSLQAMEVVKVITSLGSMLDDKLLNINILNNRYDIYNM